MQNQLERTENECHDERSSATQLRAHLEAAVRIHTAENRQHEHVRTELRTAFDDNRTQLIEYLGHEFEEKLQWEENECNFRLTSEEQQYDSLIVDLEDRNAELIAEVNSLRFNIGEPQEPKAPGVELSAAELSELREPANAKEPKETAEILVEALKSAIQKPGDDDKPKAKEAETVKLPDFPNPETYRSWKITVREAVRAASDRPDEAFKWVQEVYTKEADLDKLRETGKFLTLDTKILSSLSRDLLKVQLSGDDLATFIHNWESVIAGLNHQPEETTLRDILLRQLRCSGKLKFDLEVYDHAKEGTEKRTYEYLVT
ncbi:CPK12, partial [Symbiodinium sp. CCMP2456]